MTPARASRRPPGRLRPGQGAPRHGLPRRRGRGRRHPRGQRRRQDHHAAGHLRHGRDHAARSSFDGDELVGLDTADIVRKGVAHVPQGRGTFPDLSVEDNLASAPSSARTSEVRADIDALVRDVPRPRRAAHAAGREPVGRRAADARRRPGADEPAAAALPRRAVARPGPDDRGRAVRAVRRTINTERGITMLVVEQNAKLALASPTGPTCSSPGRSSTRAAPPSCGSDDAIRKAYLGV